MSCLFQSLSHFVNGMNENSLRHNICNYLSENHQIFDDLSTNDITTIESGLNISQYISNMRNPSTWGGSLEIKVFCNIFNVVVIVHHNNRQIEFLPSTNKPIGKCNIGYTGNHYFHM